MANFRVNSVPSWIQYTATASQTQFAIPFAFIQDADISVWQNENLLTLTTDYTLTGENTSSGGTLTLVVGATVDDIITIENTMEIDRTSIYLATISGLTGSALNNDFNRDVLMIKRAITVQDYLQLQYHPYADISQDISVTRDRLLPILSAGSSWRMNAGGTAIEDFTLPDIPVGIDGVFTADNRLVKTDLPSGDNFIQQTDIELTDGNTMQTTSGSFTLNSAGAMTINATTNINLTPTQDLYLNSIKWPTSGAAQLKGLRLQSGSSTDLEWVYFLTVTGTPVDNHVVRFDGGSGAVQSSDVIIDDVGAMSGVTELDVDNINVNGNTISSTDVDGDINLTPNGAGFVNLGKTYISSTISVGATDENTIVVAGTTYTVDIGADTDGAADIYNYGGSRHADIAGLASGIALFRSRGVHGAETIVQNGDALGTIFFAGYDGVDYALAASISSNVSNTPGSNDMPGEILINVTPDGSQTPSEVASFTSLGVQLGNANARITSISDDTTLAADSSTLGVTQHAVKTYVDSAIGSGAGGSNTQIQYNNAGAFGGDTGFTTNGAGSINIVGDLDIDNININGNTIISTDVNGNINLTPNGTGINVLANAQVTSLTASKVAVTDGSKNLASSTVDAADLPYMVLQDGSQIYALDTGAPDAYVVTLSPAPSAYVTGMTVNFKSASTNTTTSTLNVNGLGAVTIKKNTASNLVAGDISAGQMVSVAYDGTNFQMQSQLPSTSPGDSGVSFDVVQANTFSVGDIITLSGTTYVAAQADSAANAEVVGVVAAATLTDFTVQQAGHMVGLSGLTAGEVYFLDPTTPGAYTATAPTTIGQVVRPVLYADTTTTAFVLPYRGNLVEVATSNSQYDIAMSAGYSSAGAAIPIVVQEYAHVVMARSGSFTGEQGYIETAPTGAAAIVDVLKNGTSIYTTKPQFAISSNTLTAGTLKVDGTEDFVSGDRITMSVTQIGSTIAGSGLRFTVTGEI